MVRKFKRYCLPSICIYDKGYITNTNVQGTMINKISNNKVLKIDKLEIYWTLNIIN